MQGCILPGCVCPWGQIHMLRKGLFSPDLPQGVGLGFGNRALETLSSCFDLKSWAARSQLRLAFISQKKPFGCSSSHSVGNSFLPLWGGKSVGVFEHCYCMRFETQHPCYKWQRNLIPRSVNHVKMPDLSRCCQCYTQRQHHNFKVEFLKAYEDVFWELRNRSNSLHYIYKSFAWLCLSYLLLPATHISRI